MFFLQHAAVWCSEFPPARIFYALAIIFRHDEVETLPWAVGATLWAAPPATVLFFVEIPLAEKLSLLGRV